jgi:hypothetical protein
VREFRFLADPAYFIYSPRVGEDQENLTQGRQKQNSMSDDKSSEGSRHTDWTLRAAMLLSKAESFVLVLIGIALVLIAVLLLYSSMYDLYEAVHHGPGAIKENAIDILNTVLLVMMTMEIVYTVTISLKSHTLDAEPFLIIGVIAGIRRVLVITATSTQLELHPEQFHNTLVELGLLAGTVIALTGGIWILRYSAHKYLQVQRIETD